MRLTNFTDYALRILIYAGSNPERLITIDEVRSLYGLSRGHMMKIVNLLTQKKILNATRGRSGGFKLAVEPNAISIGDIVRITEPNFKIVECFSSQNECLISQFCKMPDPFNEALNAFLLTLDKYKLSDMMLTKDNFKISHKAKYPVRGPALDVN